MVKVLYFASLREAFGIDQEQIAPAPPTVDALVQTLRARGGVWADRLAAHQRWRVAVNQEMSSLANPISAGDEVAIFPPVTGG
jgi:molybdopterin synthase sulfur carrier subunit